MRCADMPVLFSAQNHSPDPGVFRIDSSSAATRGPGFWSLYGPEYGKPLQIFMLAIVLLHKWSGAVLPVAGVESHTMSARMINRHPEPKSTPDPIGFDMCRVRYHGNKGIY